MEFGSELVMDFVEEGEQAVSEYSYDFDQILNPQNLTTKEVEEPEETLYQSNEEEIPPTVCEPSNIEEQQQQSLQKLNEINTDVSIKTEMKQLIMTKVNEEITSKSLDDMSYEAEQQISNIKTKTNQLLNKIQDLEKAVATDTTRLEQSEEVLRKTDEMIVLLKERVSRLQQRYQEYRMKELSENSLNLYEKFKSLKETFALKINSKKEKIETTETTAKDLISNLRLEIVRKQELLADRRKKCGQFSEIVSSLTDDIEKQQSKKCVLQQRLNDIIYSKDSLENELQGQKELLQKLLVKKADKLTDLNNKKMKLEQQLNDSLQDLDLVKVTLATGEDEILQNKIRLKQLAENLNITKCEAHESLEKLQMSHMDLNSQLNEVTTNVTSIGAYNDDLVSKMKSLSVTYLQKCEEKLAIINDTLEQQNNAHNIKTELIRKQLENEVAKAKFEELQAQYMTSVAVTTSLETELTKEHDNIDHELMEAKSKVNLLLAEYDKCSLEAKNNREYLLANCKFFKNKSENLQKQVAEAEKAVKNLQEENVLLKTLIEKKMTQLNADKNTLAALQNLKRKLPLKSGLKTNKDSVVKKVKFNDILSFKSITSSENSTAPVANLETSLQEWLQEDKELEFNEVEKIEEEF